MPPQNAVEMVPSKSDNTPKNGNMNNNNNNNNNVKESTQPEPVEPTQTMIVIPPDGGFGWIVMLASFCCNIIVDGIVFSTGFFITPIQEHMNSSKATIALVGSLLGGFYLIVGPFVSALSNRYGFRKVTILGSLIAAAAFFLSSFASTPIELYLSYGVMGGIGFCFIYMPSVIIVGYYFEKWRPLATGVALCGSGIGTFIMAPISQYLIKTLQWQGALRIQAVMVLACGVFGLAYRPIKPTVVVDTEDEENNPEGKSLVTDGISTPAFIKPFADGRISYSVPNSSHNTWMGTPNNTNYPTAAEIFKGIPVNSERRSSQTSAQLSQVNVVPSAKKEKRSGHATPTEEFPHPPPVFSALNTPHELKPVGEVVEEGEENETLLEKNEVKAMIIAQAAGRRHTVSGRRPGSEIQANSRQSDSQANSRRGSRADVSRPLYRDDIFFSGSLAKLPQYRSQTSLGYHMSVTHVPTVKDIEEEENQASKCKICPEAVRRTLGTMLDVSLFKEFSFVLLACSGFLTMMGFFVPFIYIAERARMASIDEDTAVFLVSAIGISNTVARILCGWLSSFDGISALALNNIFITAGGIATMISGWFMQVHSQYIYTLIFGVTCAVFSALRSIIVVDLLGLEKLTNAFGILLLFQGIAAVIGSPLAGFLFDLTNSYDLPFYVAGGLMTISALLTYPLNYVKRWQHSKGKNYLAYLGLGRQFFLDKSFLKLLRMVAKEFQAVVLAAGHGTRFTDLLGNRPKCLLPVGPFPLIFYPLQLLQKYGFEAPDSSIVVPGPKAKHKQERDLVGINSENDRLLFLASTSDFEDVMTLPAHLLRSHGKISIHSGLVDAHIYLVKRWVVDYLAESDRFSTIKGELLPFIIKKQMSRPAHTSKIEGHHTSEVGYDSNDIFYHIKQDEIDRKVLETNLNNFGRLKTSHDSELIRCFAYIAPASSIGIRVNTILGFCTANRKIFDIWESLCGNIPLVSSNAIIKSTQMTNCAVAENTTLSEKTSIKSTVFGVNCLVNEKTRISDSYIMNNVTIEERVVIENCIICDKAVIKKGSILKNCLVGFNFTVNEDTVKDKVHLTDSDAFESADEEIEDKKQKNVAVTKPEKEIKIEDTKAITPPEKTTPINPPANTSNIAEEKPSSVENEASKPESLVSSWRTWGAFNVISNASKTVASITTQVSQSISTAIDSINIPEPEEMAKLHAEQMKAAKEESSVNDEKSTENNEESGFKLDSLLSGVSQISSKVVAGGLDTLEGIGKKTINILQDTDPNIKNKIRNINVNNKPNLSDLLREAKEREEPTTNNEKQKIISFEHLLDDYKGLVYLEALEILSNQSKIKIELLMKPLTDDMLTDMEETLSEIKELCEFDSENHDEDLNGENLSSKLEAATADLNVKLNFHEIVDHSKEIEHWFEDSTNDMSTITIYEKSINVMAKTCALSLNNFQKLAELLLSQDYRSTADETDALTQLATIYCSLFNYFATKFSQKLTTQSNNDNETKKMSTNLFLESSNATSYVKKAFNLFIPILQIGAV
ncbi:CLUMA_CG010346, isoform A [Clunio marinus]|uniref:CLUMA_CG010346, isoform A n=1 Tax=Clunio marinus TaxID=568069 RepID=A0A1J1IER9_9DIPT|nr:CLUMA_CG010346, isoform A [Clunio marinus]